MLVGDASHVYANGETLVLAHPEWRAEPLGDADTSTALHVFALPADRPAVAYRASGFVPGSLLSQFAIDTQGDVVRVASTFVKAGRTVTRVSTARIGDGELVAVGTSPDIAPGESLRGVRFVGDRAYLVTFLQIDPLFVVDLADPAHPRVLGEVEIPGFSTYLQALDPDHLLTIGRTTTEQGQPPVLRVFAVGNPTAPELVAEHVLPIDGSTQAEHDHHAFVFEPRLGVLAVPLDRYDGVPKATLQLLAVTPTAIALRGVVDHGLAIVPCVPPYEFEGCIAYESMRRGLFVDDLVYSISTTQVQVHALDDLATALVTVSLQ